MLKIIDVERQGDLRLDVFAKAYGLTQKEKETAGLLASGLTTPEIGEVLGIAASTAGTHVKSVFQKTGSTNRVSFVWKVVQFSPPVV